MPKAQGDCKDDGQMNETDRVREKIATLVGNYVTEQFDIVLRGNVPDNPLTADDVADSILAIPEILVKSDDQSLPEMIEPTEDDKRSAHCGQWFDNDWYYAGQVKAQETILKAVFVKVVKK
jgi:hypothetical protein